MIQWNFFQGLFFFQTLSSTDKANVVNTGYLAGIKQDLPLLSQVKEWQEIYGSQKEWDRR